MGHIQSNSHDGQPNRKQPVMVFHGQTIVVNGRRMTRQDYEKMKNQGNQFKVQSSSKNPSNYQHQSSQNFHYSNPSSNYNNFQPKFNQVQTFQTNQHSNRQQPNSHSNNQTNVQFFQVPKENSQNSNMLKNNLSTQKNKNGQKNALHSVPQFMEVQNDHFRNQNLRKSPPKHQSNQQMDLEIEQEKKKLKEKQASLNEIVKNYQKRIEQAEAFGKKMKDPRKFKEFQAEALSNYLEKIKEMNLPEKIENEKGVSQKLIVGKIASGKSSLINSYFGTNLQVGLGDTTTESKIVFQNETKDVQIIDNPGVSENFDIRSVELIEYIASSSEIYILYPDSLKAIENLIKVIAAIKPNHLYLLRNQCDRFDKEQLRNLQQQLAEDKKILKKWNLEHLPILTTSSVMPKNFDNQKVRKMMISKPKKVQIN